ncbi:diacylglycerol kinase [Halobacteriales archaeon QS_1_68_20]|nr:MAG: diacylglycerol kinase [Halobacteriales archaeon QS_1_68_20]
MGRSTTGSDVSAVADRLPEDHADTVVILNPVSGDGTHEELRRRACLAGYDLVETKEGGDARRLALAAADAGFERVVAAGGDGTLNAVAQGLYEADALDDVVFGVLPAGTGNNFAGNVGVGDLPSAFEALESDRVRQLDLGTNGERVFLNSCVGGLTAEASGATTHEMKARYGVLAYVLSTLRTAVEFDAPPLSVSAYDATGEETAWEGEVLFLLVGNARHFPLEGPTAANAEDGLLDVTLIEREPAGELLEEAAMVRLFGEEADAVTRLQAAALDVYVGDGEGMQFSFDGEMESASRLTLGVEHCALTIHVGTDYEPGGPQP